MADSLTATSGTEKHSGVLQQTTVGAEALTVHLDGLAYFAGLSAVTAQSGMLNCSPGTYATAYSDALNYAPGMCVTAYSEVNWAPGMYATAYSELLNCAPGMYATTSSDALNSAPGMYSTVQFDALDYPRDSFATTAQSEQSVRSSPPTAQSNVLQRSSTPYAERFERDGFERFARRLRHVAMPAVITWRILARTSQMAARGLVEPRVGTILAPHRAESSTENPDVSGEVRARIDALVKTAREQVIEDGMANAITRGLADLVRSHTSGLVPLLVAVLESKQTPPLIAAELLKELGRIRDGRTHAAQLWVLAYALRSSSPIARDGAGLGLARLADPDGLEYVLRAIEVEPNTELRKDLQLVADELSKAA